MKIASLAPIVLGAAIGLAAGVGGYTFIYARGYSYMSNDPEACANCHVMHSNYDAWIRSSHRSVATCNDCHTPPSFVGKYFTKASNGFWHSFAFTSGRFPEHIRIKPHNHEIAEQACRKCHAEMTQAIEGPHGEQGKTDCIQCHGAVGHP